MLNLISSVLQQEYKQESENLDKGRITGSAPPPKKTVPSPEWRTVSRIFISGPWQVCDVHSATRTFWRSRSVALLSRVDDPNDISVVAWKDTRVVTLALDYERCKSNS